MRMKGEQKASRCARLDGHAVASAAKSRTLHGHADQYVLVNASGLNKGDSANAR